MTRLLLLLLLAGCATIPNNPERCIAETRFYDACRAAAKLSPDGQWRYEECDELDNREYACAPEEPD